MSHMDEKDAIMQELVCQKPVSYDYIEKACINAGFPVHLLDKFEKSCTSASFSKLQLRIYMLSLEIPTIV